MRWLPVIVMVSLMANVALALAWFGQLMREATLKADTQSTFRYMAGERAQLQAMRAHFCPETPAPDRAAVLAWEAAARAPDILSEPYESSGLVHLGGAPGIGLKFGADDRLDGVCLGQAWRALEAPSLAERDDAGAHCPLEPLC